MTRDEFNEFMGKMMAVAKTGADVAIVDGEPAKCKETACRECELNSMVHTCGYMRETWIKANMPRCTNSYLLEWIPVDADIAPKDDVYILISFENFSVPMIGRFKNDENGGNFFVGDDDKSRLNNDLIVNAWMPLPEPYKEE